MKSKKPLDWVPIFIDKHLFGSMRHEFNPDGERGVWQDLLIFSGKDSGYIRANEGVPYPPEQLAGMFLVPVELLNRVIKKAISYGKIVVMPDKTLYLPSWDEYKLSDRHMRRFKLLSENPVTMSGKPDTEGGGSGHYRESIEIEREKKYYKEFNQLIQFYQKIASGEGIIKHRWTDKLKAKNYDLFIARRREGYHLLVIFHAIRGAEKFFSHKGCTWNVKWGMEEILMRGQSKRSKDTKLYLDKFCMADEYGLQRAGLFVKNTDSDFSKRYVPGKE